MHKKYMQILIQPFFFFFENRCRCLSKIKERKSFSSMSPTKKITVKIEIIPVADSCIELMVLLYKI